MVASLTRTAPHERRTPHSGDRFHFHPRATNPELWRTTVPLVVRERCRRHKGLVATWTAIHWLIVLHAASGRADFGVREIAEEAGVGRNELTGPGGHIQRLVDLGLIRVVGYKTFRGLREPRPIYHIDLAELERLSLDLVPEILRDRQIDRPPPAAPDPRQLQFFNALEPGSSQPDAVRSSHQTGTSPPQMLPRSHPVVQDAPANGIDLAMLRPYSVTAPSAAGAETHGSGTAIDDGASLLSLQPHSTGPIWPETTSERTDSGQTAAEFGPYEHLNRAADARNRDVDRKSDRTNEGASRALAPELLEDLVTRTTRAVLEAIQGTGLSPMLESSPALNSIPQAPAGFEPLPAPVLALWQGDDPHVSRRELHQLAMIAAECDGPTGGYGAYWLGRAIVMADLCLSERGQQRSLAYLRRVLRRWRDEASWGSDREPPEPHSRAVVADAARPRPAPPSRDEALHHPAVSAYVEALMERPNAVQAAQIAETVTDLDAWRRVLKDWQLNGWGERSVGKMLDRYQKCGAGVAAELPPSVVAIHTYPDLAPEQRDRWIRKFHAASSPADKRAVLARLQQEHPR